MSSSATCSTSVPPRNGGRRAARGRWLGGAGSTRDRRAASHRRPARDLGIDPRIRAGWPRRSTALVAAAYRLRALGRSHRRCARSRRRRFDAMVDAARLPPVDAAARPADRARGRWPDRLPGFEDRSPRRLTWCRMRRGCGSHGADAAGAGALPWAIRRLPGLLPDGSSSDDPLVHSPNGIAWQVAGRGDAPAPTQTARSRARSPNAALLHTWAGAGGPAAETRGHRPARVGGEHPAKAAQLLAGAGDAKQIDGNRASFAIICGFLLLHMRHQLRALRRMAAAPLGNHARQLHPRQQG